MGGKRYFLTCYDDFSHHINLYLLASKFDALAGLKDFATMAETQTGRKIKQIRSDGGGEFNSNTAISFYKQKGIEHLLVPPGSHQQNGRVERVHLTILNLVRTYLTDCKLPPQPSGQKQHYTLSMCEIERPANHQTVSQMICGMARRNHICIYSHLAAKSTTVDMKSSQSWRVATTRAFS
jgi:transposase InsO family protein